VILLTAVATLVGAGAHLITSSLLESAGGQGIGFGRWLLLGVPLAVVSAHVTAEIVLWLFTTRQDRAAPLHAEVGDGLGAGEQGAGEVPALAGAARSEGPLQGVPCSDSPTWHRQFRTLELPPHPPARHRATALTGPDGTESAAEPRRTTALTGPEWTALAVVLTVSAAWITEPWHGIPPEVSALAGALLITAPRLGTVTFKAAFAEVPWSLLVFMAATTALGTALISSGAADLAARHVGGSGLQLLGTIIGVSLAAHLVVQSRSARSSVLIPIVIPLAAAAGMNPAALAFASTAAAGFCHTLTSSAKPVALFADSYRPKDLLRLSAVLAPVTGLLVFAAATLLWPHLGLPLK
jgi:solute carrier family 13 (sodium-dependent dicarboxylate transporter), member 2/3/5